MKLSSATTLVASLTLSLLGAPVSGQQEPAVSNVPESVRAMIEESQGGRFAQMARMQVDLQYGEFLDSLSGGASKRQGVEDALVEVISQRAQLSSDAVTGRASPAELEAISNYAFLRSQVAPLLDRSELQRLDSQQGAIAEDQMRRNYGDQLTRMAPEISEANRQLVLDILVRHMLFTEADADQRQRLSAEDLVNQQIVSLRDAREEMQQRLSSAELDQIGGFLNQLRSNLFLNQSMSDSL